MPASSYYHSPHWKALKLEALKRDRFRCTVPGCGATRATSRLTVDHIDPRPRGAAEPTDKDVLPNLRTLCALHNNQVMQGADGERRNEGRFTIVGCDEDGFPIDPNHPWAKGRR